jgi:uncharacterized protein
MHLDFALILVFLGVVVPLLGRRRVRHLMLLSETTKRDRLTLYASTIAFQWLAAAVVLWRTGAHGISAAALGLAIPNVALTVIVTVCLSGLIIANQILGLRQLSKQPEAAQGILPQLALKIFPQDAPERLVFFAVVATVSVCEELIYRGFVQRVFQDWSNNLVVVGILGSAAMFGIAHLYQGRRGLISTLVVGLIFSTIRWWTGSLLPPLVAHFIADLLAGFLAPSRLRSAAASVAVNLGPSASA